MVKAIEIVSVYYLCCLFNFILTFAEKDYEKPADTFLQMYQSIQLQYDKQHPPQYNNTPILQHYHNRRCAPHATHEAVAEFVKDKWKVIIHEVPILVQATCLGSDSLGNVLGLYFESIICAQNAGMHYIAVAKIWEPKQQDRPSPFLQQMPDFVEHKALTSYNEAKIRLQKQCRCPGSCHERPHASWTKGLDYITSLMRKAINYHLLMTDIQTTIVRESDISTVPVGTSLPLIPDAAIHYRCGDNFIGHYGFLPFKAFRNVLLDSNVLSIFVLAEKRSRKTQSKEYLAIKCDAILNSLFTYLKQTFPKAEVLIRRGDDLYVDLARLTYAKYTICSVSTFCLWPAIASNGTAYFPKTQLIVGGDTTINLRFKWLESPPVILGASYVRHSPVEIVSVLGGSVNNKEVHEKMTELRGDIVQTRLNRGQESHQLSQLPRPVREAAHTQPDRMVKGSLKSKQLKQYARNVT